MHIKSFIKIILFIITWLSIASNSFAHNKSESYSNLTLFNDSVTGIITIPSHEVTRLPRVSQNTNSFSSSFL